jgi:acetoin utilization protein AcuC
MCSSWGQTPLREDYLSKFELSNWGFLRAFRLVKDAFGEGIYLGGGGYHPIALARAWALGLVRALPQRRFHGF